MNGTASEVNDSFPWVGIVFFCFELRGKIQKRKRKGGAWGGCITIFSKGRSFFGGMPAWTRNLPH